MADKTAHYESEGLAIQRILVGSVAGVQLVSDGLWAGINNEAGVSGDLRAWSIDGGIYQFYVPDSLSVNDGDIVYLELADITGNIPEDTAYSITPGAGKIALFKALENKVTANGAGKHYVTGKSLLHMQGG